MRLTLELVRTSTGQFEGTVEVDANSVVPFTGTLELLKVLHDATEVSDAAREQKA